MSDIIPPEDIPLKRCLKCPEGQQWHPATPEFFSRDKNRKDGLFPHCKECTKRYQKAHYARPDIQKRIRAKSAIYYAIHRDQRQAYVRRPDVRERNRSRKNRPEIKAQARTNKRRAEVKAQNRSYYSRPEVRARQRAYYSAPEQREKKRVRSKSYRSRPNVKAQIVIYSQVRRALKKSAPGTYTLAHIREQYQRQGKRCYYCQEKIAWEKRHIEHIIPLSRGGSNGIENIVISCPTCNLKKGSKLPHEWPEGGRLL